MNMDSNVQSASGGSAGRVPSMGQRTSIPPSQQFPATEPRHLWTQCRSPSSSLQAYRFSLGTNAEKLDLKIGAKVSVETAVKDPKR